MPTNSNSATTTSATLTDLVPNGTIRLAHWHEPGATELRRLAVAELCMRYETDSVGEEPDPTKLAAQVVVTTTLGDTDLAVACAALMDVTGVYPEFSGPVLEVKRVFVHPDYRGRGLSRQLMERIATEAGHYAKTHSLENYRLVLETGTKQPEAMALYISLGYKPIANYGEWQDDPLSRCFELPQVPARAIAI